MILALRLAQVAVALLCGVWTDLAAQDVWDQADRQIRRLAPSVFTQLLGAVRADLERRACTIPQVWFDTTPANVISGHFRSAARVDWAVLCSVNRVSTILVYWEGRADSVAELGTGPDKGVLQGVGDGQIGYSRAISAVGADIIRQHYRWHGGPEPPPRDHQGIDDAFVGKASVVWYWYQGKWLLLTGAD